MSYELVQSLSKGIPNCPPSPLPQTNTLPLLSTTMLCNPPTDIYLTWVSPMTSYGLSLDISVPPPNSPPSPYPQANTFPSSVRATECSLPAPIYFTSDTPSTITPSFIHSLFLLCPHYIYSLSPHATTLLLTNKAK